MALNRAFEKVLPFAPKGRNLCPKRYYPFGQKVLPFQRHFKTADSEPLARPTEGARTKPEREWHSSRKSIDKSVSCGTPRL